MNLSLPLRVHTTKNLKIYFVLICNKMNAGQFNLPVQRDTPHITKNKTTAIVFVFILAVRSLNLVCQLPALGTTFK